MIMLKEMNYVTRDKDHECVNNNNNKNIKDVVMMIMM